MEKIKFGHLTMCKMGVEEYNNAYEADVEEQYGENLKELAWMEKYDNNGEVVACSMELMLIFGDNTFAYTSRGFAQKSDLAYAFEAILWMEEL